MEASAGRGREGNGAQENQKRAFASSSARAAVLLFFALRSAGVQQLAARSLVVACRLLPLVTPIWCASRSGLARPCGGLPRCPCRRLLGSGAESRRTTCRLTPLSSASSVTKWLAAFVTVPKRAPAYQAAALAALAVSTASQ